MVWTSAATSLKARPWRRVALRQFYGAEGCVKEAPTGSSESVIADEQDESSLFDSIGAVGTHGCSLPGVGPAL